MTAEEIAVESTKTVAESILARMPASGERTVKFHGIDLRMKEPLAMALVDVRSRATVEAATRTAEVVKNHVKKGKKSKDSALEMNSFERERILQRTALVENALVIKACADAADPAQLAAFTEDQLFKAVYAEGPGSPAINAAVELTRIDEVSGNLDPFGSLETKESG